MRDVKKTVYTVASVLFPAAAVVLEALPGGAVCVFAPSPGERVKETFSYFDPVPFGYGNVAPLIASVLTCLLLIAAVLSVFWDNGAVKVAAFGLSAASAVVSLLPLLAGAVFFTVTGAGISVCLAIETILLIPPGKKAPEVPEEN